MSERRPGRAFAALSLIAVAAISGVVYSTKSRQSATPADPNLPVVDVESGQGQRIYFRYGVLGAGYGKIAHVDYAASTVQAELVESLDCEVVHASAARGICLAADRGVVTTYSAKVFSLADHAVLAELPLAGVPSRTRVAASGRYGATTVFVTGHGYDSVDFSTQTLLIDLTSNNVIADVETFTFIDKNGEPFSNADFNVWGVTFAADDTFYATLSTQKQHLLVRGDVATRRATVVRDNVECPSVSPDGSRLAYKKRFVRDGRIGWELHVLDLATMNDTALAEERSVDDQLEWLDAEQVLYSVGAEGAAGSDVWRTAADGTGAPSVFLRAAYSPAVVR
jgi:hypothetical protein